MPRIPDAYYQLVMDHAPYLYVIPPDTPDYASGRAVSAAAFAIDFLLDAYRLESSSTVKMQIYAKLLSLADFILNQQCTNPDKLAYGGFRANENSTLYYSIDACRCIPALLKIYELTGRTRKQYFDAAKLAGYTFLKAMQDEDYGGFHRAVDLNDTVQTQMDVECLYGLIGLKMLAEIYDSINIQVYREMMSRAADFLKQGFEGFWLYYDPSDDKWHREGLNEQHVYADVYAYALLGLMDYEGWSLLCRKVYTYLNTVKPNSVYPAYNPAICWAGYIDVASHFPACDYYDAVTTGILWRIRRIHDLPSYRFSKEVLEKYEDEFMFWGVKQDDFTPVENKYGIITVSWLGSFLANYAEAPTTRFMQITKAHGEPIAYYMTKKVGEALDYMDPIDVEAVVTLARADEVLVEPGYLPSDYITVYTYAALRPRDKVRYGGKDYEVLNVQLYSWRGDPAYYKANCRRLIGA